MSKYIISGGKPLFGKVNIQGAKNSVLPQLAAAVLTDDDVTVENCPEICDVFNMGKIIQSLGGMVCIKSHQARINCGGIKDYEIPSVLASSLRSSIFLLGPILSRLKRAKVAYPGGCDIGLRPIDIHLKAFATLGVKIEENSGFIYCSMDKLKTGSVTLDYPSVGATENLMMLTAKSDGVTIIENAAREPEVVDLQNLLNSMGADIKGAGCSRIEVSGVKSLRGVTHTAIPDRIVLGTYLIAVAMCGGRVELIGGDCGHLMVPLSKIEKSSCKIECVGGKIIAESGGNPMCFESLITQPYPGFPTDLQAQMMSLGAVSRGTSVITESIFETRFKHVPELIKMGAKISVRDRTAYIRGVNKLSGAEVFASDLRGGAALVLAGLKAEGQTTVCNISHIERGYEDMDTILRNLGAEILKI